MNPRPSPVTRSTFKSSHFTDVEIGHWTVGCFSYYMYKGKGKPFGYLSSAHSNTDSLLGETASPRDHPCVKPVRYLEGEGSAKLAQLIQRAEIS
jgi:hypothetical protein